MIEKLAYINKHPLFRSLNAAQVEDMKACAKTVTFRFEKQNDVTININNIEFIHPIIRLELIKILKESLVKQGELEE